MVCCRGALITLAQNKQPLLRPGTRAVEIASIIAGMRQDGKLTCAIFKRMACLRLPVTITGGIRQAANGASTKTACKSPINRLGRGRSSAAHLSLRLAASRPAPRLPEAYKALLRKNSTSPARARGARLPPTLPTPVRIAAPEHETQTNKTPWTSSPAWARQQSRADSRRRRDRR